jgi:hypothetical protein
MSRNQSLYHKALIEWKGELEKKQKAILEDKGTNLRDGLHRKLIEIVGPEYAIEIKEAEDDSENLMLDAVVDYLDFIGFRGPAGEINVILVVLCLGCRHKMTSNLLTRLADLGQELLQLEMTGRLSNHECSSSDNVS